MLKRDKEKKEKHQFEFPFKEPKHKEHNIQKTQARMQIQRRNINEGYSKEKAAERESRGGKY